MKLKAFLSLTRIDHGIMYGIGVIIGMIVVSNFNNLNLTIALYGFLTAVFLQSSAFALNDYFDYESDIANQRFDRPLVRGELKREDALFTSIILAPFGLLFSLLISFTAFLLALLIVFLGYLYDIKLKELGIIGNAYIAFSMAVSFVYGGFIAEKLTFPLFALASIAFLSGLGREIMKSIEDVEGDALRNVKTVARIYGIKVAGKVSSILLTLSIILSFFVLLIPEYFDLKYIIPVIIADIILLDSSIKLYRGVKKSDIPLLRRKTIIGMMFGLLAFLTGSLS